MRRDGCDYSANYSTAVMLVSYSGHTKADLVNGGLPVFSCLAICSSVSKLVAATITTASSSARMYGYKAPRPQDTSLTYDEERKTYQVGIRASNKKESVQLSSMRVVRS